MINTRVNSIRQVHEEKEFLNIESKDGITTEEIRINILELLENGVSSEMIREDILPHLGFKFSSLPDEIKILFK